MRNVERLVKILFDISFTHKEILHLLTHQHHVIITSRRTLK